MSFRRLMMSRWRCFEFVRASSSRRSFETTWKSVRWMISRRASAPIAALNASPYLARFSRYSSSGSSCRGFKGVEPGSTTT